MPLAVNVNVFIAWMALRFCIINFADFVNACVAIAIYEMTFVRPAASDNFNKASYIPFGTS